jgi:hypothetical protein
MGRSGTTNTEAVKVSKSAIPASVFAIPAGYKEVESPLARMSRR